MTESQEVEAPRKLRWINAWVIVLLSVACMWLLFTRGEAVYPGYTEPFALPLAPFIFLAAAILIASGWHRRRTPNTDAATRQRWIGAIVAFWILSLPVWHQVGARVSGEGIAYYVYLRSAVFDRDLDFSNEYEAFNLDDIDPRLINNLTPTGVPRNVHSVGPAVVWAPFLAVGQALESLGTNPTEMTPFGVERRTRTALNRDTLGPGYSHPSVAAVGFGSIVLLGLASVLWYREIAQTLAPRDAAVGVIGVIIAGPLLWYTFFEPSMSHAPTAACLVFAMVAWRAWARDPSVGRALLIGLTAGLLAMQRWQFILWIVVPLGHLLIVAVQRARWDYGSRAPMGVSGGRMTIPVLGGHLGLMLLGTVIGLLPQFFAWKLVWGSWLINPMGGGYLSWSEPEILGVLWSLRHGLFTWHPVLLLAVIGFIPAWKLDRALTGVSLGLLLVMVYVNGAVTDWWGNDAFGQRRFAGLYPAFAWGLSAALASVPSRRRRAFVAVVVTCAMFNLGLAHGYRTDVIRRDWWISFGDAMRCQVVAVADASQWSLRRTAERFPALAGFFYGVVDGHFMLDSYGLNPTVNVGADDRRYVGAGWGSPERRSAGGFRWVIGTSSDVWLPLRYMRDHHLTVSGWPLSGDAIQRLRVSVNGELLNETVVMEREGTWRFRVDEDVLRPGLNRFRLHLAWAKAPSDADRRPLSAAFSQISIEATES